MNIQLCELDWNAISAISNIIMALIAFLSLGFSLCLLFYERYQRKEDVRARLYVSIVDWHNHYMLKISNVGKEAAYHIKLSVSGKPVTENLFPFVREVFDKLSNIQFCLEAGKSAYYLISPDEQCRGEEGIEGIETHSGKEIREWLKKYDDEDITIMGSYCDKYEINENFSIREFLLYGSFDHKDAMEEIADAFVSRDSNVKNVQKNIDLIARAIR